MKIRLFFVFTLFFGLTMGVNGQRISGTVRSVDGASVSFANIRVMNSAQGVTAGLDGRFSLELEEGSHDLLITAVGYASKVVHLTLTGSSMPDLQIILDRSTEILAEIVVTATKKEVDILKVPASVSTLSAKKIEDTRTWGLEGLSAMVPNYNYQNLGVAFQQIQSIRGIQVFSENPAVSTYIDDVNNIDILANGFALTDIERIEVLRGPQGTLFGRNAMGGVVNIITRQPGNRTEGYAETGFGNFGLQRHAVGIKTPLLKDKLYVGVNGLFQSQDGYWKNDTTGTFAVNGAAHNQPVGGEKNLYGNMFIKWLATSRLNLTLNVKSQRDWSENSAFFVSQSNYDLAFKKPEKIFLRRIAAHERNITNTSLVAKYFGSQFQLTSVSAFQTIGLSFADVDFPGFYHSFYKSKPGESLPPQQVFTQELRMNSRSEGKLQFTAGVYGFSQVGYEPSTNTAYELAASEAGYFGLPEGAFVISRNKSNNYGLAGYGEMAYALSSQMSATLGLRYDWENRQATFNGFGDAVFAGGQVLDFLPDTTVDGSYSALSPKVSVSYQLSPVTQSYLTYSRGFRAGGVNAQRYPVNSGIKQTFDPEYSDNFEIGYKTALAHNRLRMAASAFYISWKGLQFFNLAAPFTYARENVGNAESHGLELEIAAIPLRGLQVDANVGLNKTAYRDFDLTRVNYFTGEEVMTPIGGNSLSNAPSHTVFLGLQYEPKIAGSLVALMRMEVRHMGAYYTDIQNQLEQPSYTLLNARLGVSYGKTSLSIWGQNLANTTYLAFGTADTSFGVSVRTASPRTFGVTLNTKF